MKVSFDFDGTLSLDHVQEYARELIGRGIEVWIVTSRFENADRYNEFFGTTGFSYDHKDLEEVAKDLGIPKDKIVFTNMGPKEDYLINKGFKFHLDDDYGTLRPIQRIAKTPAINVRKSSFKNNNS